MTKINLLSLIFIFICIKGQYIYINSNNFKVPIIKNINYFHELHKKYIIMWQYI